MQRYRSGHNEAVLKTVCPKGHVGSNPTLCVKAFDKIKGFLFSGKQATSTYFLEIKNHKKDLVQTKPKDDLFNFHKRSLGHQMKDTRFCSDKNKKTHEIVCVKKCRKK